MNITTIKGVLGMTTMIILIAMAIFSNDLIHSRLFASIGIFVGALTVPHLSDQGPKHRKGLN